MKIGIWRYRIPWFQIRGCQRCRPLVPDCPGSLCRLYRANSMGGGSAPGSEGTSRMNWPLLSVVSRITVTSPVSWRMYETSTSGSGRLRVWLMTRPVSAKTGLEIKSMRNTTYVCRSMYLPVFENSGVPVFRHALDHTLTYSISSTCPKQSIFIDSSTGRAFVA